MDGLGGGQDDGRDIVRLPRRFLARVKERKVEIVPRGGIRFEARPAGSIEMLGGRGNRAP
jgi:hypothetical protein